MMQDKIKKERAIVEGLLPFLKDKKKIGIYIPQPQEADIYTPLKNMGIYELYTPVCLKDYEMEFRKAENLKKARFALWEPDNDQTINKKDLDVIVVPMVKFNGLHRKGHGKGYYDRYLKDYGGLKIGVAFDEQKDEFTTHFWDVDMDAVVTPTAVIKRR